MDPPDKRRWEYAIDLAKRLTSGTFVCPDDLKGVVMYHDNSVQPVVHLADGSIQPLNGFWDKRYWICKTEVKTGYGFTGYVLEPKPE